MGNSPSTHKPSTDLSINDAIRELLMKDTNSADTFKEILDYESQRRDFQLDLITLMTKIKVKLRRQQGIEDERLEIPDLMGKARILGRTCTAIPAELHMRLFQEMRAMRDRLKILETGRPEHVFETSETILRELVK
jgi:hypothetical protein